MELINLYIVQKKYFLYSKFRKYFLYLSFFQELTSKTNNTINR